MWKLESLMQAFPARWELYQIITTVDATTFEVYSNNIGPQMFEHITTADMVVFNRCTDALKEMLYKKNIKAMNPRAAIYLDDLNGNSEDYARNMPLPFDVDADIIDIHPKSAAALPITPAVCASSAPSWMRSASLPCSA